MILAGSIPMRERGEIHLKNIVLAMEMWHGKREGGLRDQAEEVLPLSQV